MVCIYGYTVRNAFKRGRGSSLSLVGDKMDFESAVTVGGERVKAVSGL